MRARPDVSLSHSLRMTMQRYDIFASQLYANGHRPKKKCKKIMGHL